MKIRTWRASVLGAAGIAVVVLLATQSASGQPATTYADDAGRLARQSIAATATPAKTGIPESGSLLVLGAAFVVVAQQLRRLT
jgi:hypothetical protein